jgi:hypothetical protein
MSLTQQEKQKAMSWWLKLPGKRGVDIPEGEYDKVYPVAAGITLGVWGRQPHPRQMQWLHDQGITEPADVHAAFAGLPHPGAPNVTVGEYPQYAKAYQTYQEHSH